MRPRQRPISIGRVVECHRCPIARVVASVARCWEGRRDVTWIRRPGEICLMAAVAVCWQSRVIVICVALHAGHRGMGSRQREDRSVIESRCSPVRRRVA